MQKRIKYYDDIKHTAYKLTKDEFFRATRKFAQRNEVARDIRMSIFKIFQTRTILEDNFEIFKINSEITILFTAHVLKLNELIKVYIVLSYELYKGFMEHRRITYGIRKDDEVTFCKNIDELLIHIS